MDTNLLHVLRLQPVRIDQAQHRIDRTMGGIAGGIALHIDTEIRQPPIGTDVDRPIFDLRPTGRRMSPKEPGTVLQDVEGGSEPLVRQPCGDHTRLRGAAGMQRFCHGAEIRD
ncbi:hypothetical protein GALL_471790 [mine drainage metagenome]|uniref:Uncharacterized protein n=1 Tax=mine drainage metagenome TaxID=410659 RepID=A0A1J5PTZ0_9ZZZZ